MDRLNREVSRKDVIFAAKQANAHEFIKNNTPRGYDSIIGERGVKLSGGQRQRIAIARALITNPSLLIFDECTSSLDSESEVQIKKSMKLLKEKRITQVIIAHRLSTVLHADQIVLLDEGRIVEIGNHKQLLERAPLYKRLVELQFKDVFTSNDK